MRDQLLAHYRRWNIQVSDEEEYQHFLFRMHQLTQSLNQELNDRGVLQEAAQFFDHLAGKRLFRAGTPTRDHGIGVVYVPNLLFGGSLPFQEMVNRLQLFFFTLHHIEAHDISKDLAAIIRKVLSLTPSINLEIAEIEGSVILYPRGASILDEQVVNQTLAWLEPYPDAMKSFEHALQFYMSGDKSKFRNLLDELRFSLEQLLKSVLDNEKSFENQKVVLLPWLKAKGVHEQTVSMYQTVLFSQYSKFQNDAVKHGEKFSEDEIEFTIYLTGTLMRLILQLEQKSSE